MKNHKIIEQINNPHKMNNKDIANLKAILAKYPYFQTAHLLLAKAKLNINEDNYIEQIKKAAVYSINRQKLFELISLKKQKTKTNTNKNTSKIINSKNEAAYSFSEWLSLSRISKIKRPANEKIIDDFIEKKISISRQTKKEFFNANDIAKESLIENIEIITPMLAKVYFRQGHYEKAIDAYKKLSLKYPKKNSLFANQIKLIEKLKKEE